METIFVSQFPVQSRRWTLSTGPMVNIDMPLGVSVPGVLQGFPFFNHHHYLPHPYTTPALNLFCYCNNPSSPPNSNPIDLPCSALTRPSSAPLWEQKVAKTGPGNAGNT